MAKWTEQEMNTLRENYPKMHNQELPTIIDRTVGSIRLKANSMGLVKYNFIKQRKKNRIWTKEELNLFTKEYQNKTNKELMITLNKDNNQIINKAQKLGLKKTKETLSICNLGNSSERMKLNNPMKNPQTLEKMRKSKIKFYKDLREKGIKLKQKKHNFEPKINLENKKEFIIEKYNSGLTLRQVGLLLGVSANTIKRRMIKWGSPRRTECKYSNFHTSEDGHVVKSSMELECDNWLFNNGIIHVYEKRLGETRFLCDFFIPKNNMYIEIFGLTDNIYKERFKRKLRVYEALGLINNLLIILPKDKISQKLNFLLEFSETQRSMNKYEK